MAVLRHLREALDTAGVFYEILYRERTHLADELLGMEDDPARDTVVTVVCLAGEGAGERSLLAVVPAGRRLDLAMLSRASGLRRLRVASQLEVDARFPGSEPGAMPPYGVRYGVPVWADERLSLSRHIAFRAGTHQLTVRMTWVDYVRLAAPYLADFAVAGDAP